MLQLHFQRSVEQAGVRLSVAYVKPRLALHTVSGLWKHDKHGMTNMGMQ